MMTVTVGPERGTLEVLSRPERAASALDPDRRRLLEALCERPDSASGLARRLGDSRQRLNYHLRGLEKAGLVELAEERRRGNCVERVMRAVARRFVVDPGVLGELAGEPGEIGDRFSAAYLIALAARTVREVGRLIERARRERKRLATAGIETEVVLARPVDFHAFAEDLSGAIARVVAKHHDERASGRAFRIVAGVYPAPEGSNDGRAKEERSHGT